MNYNTNLKSNNTELQAILSSINSLPEEPAGTITISSNGTHDVKDYANAVVEVEESGGVTLPVLETPATEDEVFLNKEFINQNGEGKRGTFTIESELTTQTDLITQLQTLVAQKASYNTIYIGASAPTDDIGVDGDIYIIRSDAT